MCDSLLSEVLWILSRSITSKEKIREDLAEFVEVAG
jgi:lipocalin